MVFVCMVCADSNAGRCTDPKAMDSTTNDANNEAYAYVGSEATAK